MEKEKGVPKNPSAYQRNYYGDGILHNIDVPRADIEQMVNKKEVWRTTKWLCEKKHHGCARFDFTISSIATKVAKKVVTQEEMESVNKGLFKQKENELLSIETYDAIRKYVFKCWKEFEKYNMVKFTKVRYNHSFGRRRTYTYRETAVKLTEKGKRVEV